MVIDWKTYSLPEWADMTLDQWATYELEIFTPGSRYYVAAAAVHTPGAVEGEVCP